MGSPQPHCLFAPSPAPFLTVESPIRKSVGGFAFASCAKAAAGRLQVKSKQVAISIFCDEGIRQYQKKQGKLFSLPCFRQRRLSRGPGKLDRFALLPLTISVIGLL